MLKTMQTDQNKHTVSAINDSQIKDESTYPSHMRKHV